MRLLSDDGDSADDLSKIEINHEFARRYEHNKKREDLHRYEEMKNKGIIDSDNEDDESSEDDEDDDIANISSKQDLKFFDALIKVRNKDPILKNNDIKLFGDSDSDNDNGNDNVNVNEIDDKKKKKKMYLKDVTAMHLIENGPEFGETDDRDKKMSYKEEQEALRKEFLDAVEKEEDDGGEFLKVKDAKGDEESEDGEYVKKLDEYFKEDEKLDENERFLKDYFRKKMWLEKEDKGDKSKGFDMDIDDGLDVSEDEEELYRQDDYEREFNFRFQEDVPDRVLGYSRNVDGSVRKIENARKVQRKNKEERMALADAERREELKYLKNLKKKEMNEKIRKIREIAGFKEDEEFVLDGRDLEEEFDPEKYDKKMKKAFDDSFYEAEDVDPEFGSDDEDDGELKKPNFDDEDDLLGLPKGWDVEEFGKGDGFLATRERTLKNKVANGGLKEQTHDDKDEDEEEEEEAEEEPVLEERKKRKRKTSKIEEELIKKELEEYYKLDYEDTIGDLKTRFRYRPVNKNTYGLKPKEILVVDDKELNQLIPLKKLATYREEEFVVPRNKIKEQKQRIRSLLKGESSNGPDNGSKRSRHDSDGLENGSKRSKHDDKDAETEKPESDEENEDSKKPSRKQRRKMKQRELELSTSRKVAYNMLPPKPKNKKKSKA